MLRNLFLASCFLWVINTTGPDPTDFLLFLCAGLWWLLTVTVTDGPVNAVGVVKMYARDAVFAFTGFAIFYVASLVVGRPDWSFVVTFCSNLIFFWFLISYWLSGEGEAIERSIVYGTASSVIIAVVIMMAGLNGTIPVLFDVVRDGRFMGLYGDPNLLAVSLIPAIFMCVERLAFSCLRNERFFLTGILALLLFSLAATQSRSAWLGFAFGVAIYFRDSAAIRRFSGWWIFAAGMGVLAIGFAANGVGAVDGVGNSLYERVESIFHHENVAEEDRFEFYYTRQALKLIPDHILGVGPGGTRYATNIVSADGDPIGAHNSYIQIATDYGGGAFVFLILAIFITVRESALIFIKGRWCGPAYCTACLASFFVIGMFQDLTQWRVFWIVPAFAWAGIVQSRIDRRQGCSA